MSAEIEEKLESMEIQDDEVSAPSDYRDLHTPTTPKRRLLHCAEENSRSSGIYIFFLHFFRLASALITITTIPLFLSLLCASLAP